MADDGKRSEAEWTLYTAGMTGSAAKRSGRCVMLELKERGVPGGEGTAMIPDGRPADRLKNGSKNGSSFYMIRGPFWGPKIM